VNLENYFPVLLFILVGIGVGVVPQVLGYLLGNNKPDAAKLSPYECGFEAFEDARMKFDVRYYLVAILFICLIWKRHSSSHGASPCANWVGPALSQ
jgi:NADH-quinone oxidoreductase subunit A